MLISSFRDDRYEFPFYRGYSLAEKLYEENARNDNGNWLLIIVLWNNNKNTIRMTRFEKFFNAYISNLS